MIKGWTRSISLLLVAAVVAFGGVMLFRYADADDSPGGMVIGWVVVGTAAVIGVQAIRRRDPA